MVVPLNSMVTLKITVNSKSEYKAGCQKTNFDRFIWKSIPDNPLENRKLGSQLRNFAWINPLRKGMVVPALDRRLRCKQKIGCSDWFYSPFGSFSMSEMARLVLKSQYNAHERHLVDVFHPTKYAFRLIEPSAFRFIRFEPRLVTVPASKKPLEIFD